MSEAKRERLVEIQKREQLKGLLCNKFKLKYGSQANLSRFIDIEVQKFLTNDRLTENNLKNLDSKIMKEADNRDKKSQILDDRKSQRSHSATSQISRRSHRSNGGLSATNLSELDKRNGEKLNGLGPDAISVRSRRSAVSNHSRRSDYSYASKLTKQSAYSEINENDEWVAIQKFNTLLHYEEQK